MSFKKTYREMRKFYFNEWRGSERPSPAFDGEIIKITRAGWHHIVNHTRRSRKVMLERMRILPLARDMIEKISHVQDYERDGYIEYWGLQSLLDDKRVIRVVIRSCNGGQKHFFSTFIQESRNKRKKHQKKTPLPLGSDLHQSWRCRAFKLRGHNDNSRDFLYNQDLLSRCTLVIVGAGDGRRYGKPKEQIGLAGEFLIDHILSVVKKLQWVSEVIFVGSGQYNDVMTVEGGKTRRDSVLRGIEQATEKLVIVHNLANPLATVDDFQRVYDELSKERCVAYVGQPVVDTLRHVSKGTVDRSDMWRVQTPQGFYREDLVDALEKNTDDITDEIQLFEGTGMPIKAIRTSPMNIKITYPEDLEMMEQYLGHEVRMGIGEDSHAFDKKSTVIASAESQFRKQSTVRNLVLGGVVVPDHPKLKANSDGDVILHALFNAISSALGGGSLGPTADPMCEAGVVDSKQYLAVIIEEMKERGYRLGNISISLECKAPKIEPLADELKRSLSAMLDVNMRAIGITAHSGDGMTSFGKGEGIRCACTVTLIK